MLNYFYRIESKAIGKPKPVGKWFKHGKEIKHSEEFIIEEFEDGTSILTMKEVFPDDSGEIKYEACNPLGVVSTVTELEVEGTYIFMVSI